MERFKVTSISRIDKGMDGMPTGFQTSTWIAEFDSYTEFLEWREDYKARIVRVVAIDANDQPIGS